MILPALLAALLLSLLLSLQTGALAALLPEQVLVVANRNVPASTALADAYMKARGIPESNLFLAWLPDQERIDRELYDVRLRDPLRKVLAASSRPIRCLAVMYGLPLRVAEPKPNAEDERRARELEARVKALEADIAQAAPEAGEALKQQRGALKEDRARLLRQEWGAALDSELALLQADYPLERWVPNPAFMGRPRKDGDIAPEKVLLVGRLDAPTPDIARRMLADSLAAEGNGLSGKAYFDARWTMPQDPAKASGYAFYDMSIHLAARRVQASGVASAVVVDDRQELFQPGQAPDAALYCGWYSLTNYVPAFTWRPGAVGYHIASGELGSLRNPNNQWCRRMLQEGVAATVGPVAEPYAQGFPVPEAFFALLAGGRHTLAECYMLSLPWLSWQMVLLGDPLYTPFRSRTKP